jgi:Kef-type K+ transport system membrane component KefB
MSDGHEILITLGGLLLLGLLTDALGRHTPLPRVTLLLAFGFLIGPSGLRLLPDSIVGSFDLLAKMALVMVGFLMGGQLTVKALRAHGRDILCISMIAVIVTVVVESAALLAFGIPVGVALILAGIAPATAPAATLDVVQEAKAEGPFAKTLLGVVALDDAWGLIVFSVCLSASTVFISETGGSTVLMALREVGGALLLGILLGLPTAYLTGRIKKGEPTLAEALGIVFLCGGLAIWLDVSFLLASMALGVVVVNLAKHHSRPFHAIEDIEWPFMILFFVLAGALLDVSALKDVQLAAVVYILARVVGRILGGWIGARVSGADQSVRRWIGLAMMPQAGVALGMALVASTRIPALQSSVLPVVIGSTVVFELAGPICTRFALRRSEKESI